MALEELMGFANSASSVIGFALLLIVLSYNFSQLNLTSAIANSQSFATSLGPRLISSPNCFAYQYYSPNGTESVIPGRIDVRKLQEDQFLSCLQYIYNYQSSLIPLNGFLIDSAVGINIKVEDVSDPSAMLPIQFSNFAQYEVGSAFKGLKSEIGTESTVLYWAGFAVSAIINVILAVATVGTSLAFISPLISIPVGANFYDSYFSSAITLTNIENEPSYQESFPVILQFSNSLGQPTFSNYGLITITINYAIFPYAGNKLAI